MVPEKGVVPPCQGGRNRTLVTQCQLVSSWPGGMEEELLKWQRVVELLHPTWQTMLGARLLGSVSADTSQGLGPGVWYLSCSSLWVADKSPEALSGLSWLVLYCCLHPGRRAVLAPSSADVVCRATVAESAPLLFCITLLLVSVAKWPLLMLGDQSSKAVLVTVGHL